MNVDKQIAALQADLNSANHITYLTGAGVSTPSHIPDYRSKNGQTAKAGTNVNVDDELELKLGNRIIVVKVTGLSEHANKENAKTMFEVVKEEKIQDSI